MTKFKNPRILSWALVLIAIAVSVNAEVPQKINYQGRLTDSAGDPLSDTTLDITFSICRLDDVQVWTSGPQQVEITNGTFNYALGSNVPLTFDIISSTYQRFLGIKVGDDDEIVPRTELISVPYAYKVGTVDGALGGTIIGDIDLSADIYAQDHYFEIFYPSNIFFESQEEQSAIFQIGSKFLYDSEQGVLSLGLSPDDYGFPTSDGTAGQVMSTNGNGQLSWTDGASGDITEVTAGSGLTGGGDIGSVELAVATDGITSAHIGTDAVTSDEIEDDAIMNSDIHASANIWGGKIDGTAATWNYDNFFYELNSFNGLVQFNDSVKITNNYHADATTTFYDSTMTVNNYGVRMGDDEAPSPSAVLYVNRSFNDIDSHHGVRTIVRNNSTSSDAENHTIFGISSKVYSAISYYGDRVGVAGSAGAISYERGNSYGVRGYGFGGDAAYGIYASGQGSDIQDYGIYATCGISDGPYGGYFYGDLHATGSNTKGAGGYKIDHPKDPENMYLAHSDVSSPEMKNIYDGTIITDTNGDATVTLPSYFESLNNDFRYQLTVIGSFAQAIVSEEIKGNIFAIKTDKPNVKVSWQVTGIRKDAFAKAKSIQVEMVKDADDQGYYQNPELFGFGIEKSVDYKHHRNIEESLRFGFMR